MRFSYFKTCVSCIVLLLLSGCSRDDAPPLPAVTALRLSPAEQTAAPGSIAQLDLILENLEPSVFALSFQLTYDARIVSFNDSSGVVPGGFFSTEALYFAHHDDSLIYVTVSNLRGQQSASGSGRIVSLRFTAEGRGSSVVAMPVDHVDFYNQDGYAVNADGLEFGSAVIHVN